MDEFLGIHDDSITFETVKQEMIQELREDIEQLNTIKEDNPEDQKDADNFRETLEKALKQMEAAETIEEFTEVMAMCGIKEHLTEKGGEAAWEMFKGIVDFALSTLKRK